MVSVFQFSNPVLTKLNFVINDDFDSSIERKLVVNVEFKTDIEVFEKEQTALVILHCKLGEKSDQFPFYIEADEQANYRWGYDDDGNMVDNPIQDPKTLKSLLNINAPTLLLSYLRPIIAQITSASPFDTYNIPYMDFSKGVNPEEQSL